MVEGRWNIHHAPIPLTLRRCVALKDGLIRPAARYDQPQQDRT